ncbi:MAG: hypothetical protein ACUVX9_17210 [Anaerolineae bacterium]
MVYHRTSPRLVLSFSDATRRTVENGPTTYYSMPYVPADAAGWQSVVAQAVTPDEARYVRLLISTEVTGLNRGRPYLVDDVSLQAVRWE